VLRVQRCCKRMSKEAKRFEQWRMDMLA